MHHSVRLGLLAILIGFFSCQQASAQDQVSLQFISIPKAENPLPVELIVGDGKTILVDIPTNRISPVYKVNRLSKWTIGKTFTNKEGNSNFKVFGTADSIKDSEQLILVIRSGKGNEDGLKLMPVSNSEKKLGGGSYLLFNASTIGIKGTLSDKEFEIKSEEFTVVKPPPSKVKGEFKYCDVVLFHLRGTTPRPFLTSTWRISDKARSFIIFYNDLKSKKLRMHSIRDYTT